jgi:hypothetical protein
MNRTLHKDAGALVGLRTTAVQTWCQECHIPRPNPHRALLDSPHREGTRT